MLDTTARLETLEAAILANLASDEAWAAYIEHCQGGQDEWASLAKRCLAIRVPAGRILFCRHAEGWPLGEAITEAAPRLARYFPQINSA